MDIIKIERYGGPLDQLYASLGIQPGEFTDKLNRIDPNDISESVLSREDMGIAESLIGFNIIGLSIPIGVIRGESVIGDFRRYGIIKCSETMPYSDAATIELGRRFGTDRILPVSDFTLSGVTVIHGKPSNLSHQVTKYFKLPKSITEYAI